MSGSAQLEYPCSLTIYVPFPTPRLAQAAIGTLSVDQELSQLVTRSFSLTGSVPADANTIQEGPVTASLATGDIGNRPAGTAAAGEADRSSTEIQKDGGEELNVLKTVYKATTNRMLRVAVNGFFESLGVIVQVMEELDTDVLHEKGLDGLEGVQGVEQGLTGTTLTGA